MPTTFVGDIESVIACGEYDQGDECLVDYDELADLVEQARFFTNWVLNHVDECDKEGPWSEELITDMSIVTNRPLHPVLGGPSPYTGFLSLGS